jgi:hypothetical protein
LELLFEKAVGRERAKLVNFDFTDREIREMSY